MSDACVDPKGPKKYLHRIALLGKMSQIEELYIYMSCKLPPLLKLVKYLPMASARNKY